MSGHSKWSNIKRKKAVIDGKRSGVFTKMANAIMVAVRKGGGIGDPDMNFALRLAVDKARAANMPKENIERAIDKGMGKGADGKTIEELLLEGYGPGGVALVMEAVTDNRNRTVSEVKNILEKNGGRLGEPGSVMYQFDRVGLVEFGGTMTDDLELALIDLGLIDFETDEGRCRLYVQADSTKSVADYLAQHGVSNVESALIYRPKTLTDTTSHDDAIGSLMEALEDNEDIQEIYANAL